MSAIGMFRQPVLWTSMHIDEGLCRESLTGLSLLGINPRVAPASPKNTPPQFRDATFLEAKEH